MQDFGLTGAQRAAMSGRLEAWVHEYLCGPARNPEFSRGLRLEPRRWLGPVEVPLSMLHRNCGPEPEMPFREPCETWERAVGRLAATPAPLEAFPPLLVRYEQGNFVVTDGNHRHAAFGLRGLATCWAIIWYPNEAEYSHHETRGFRVWPS